ncbi:MAG: TIM barrel protein [Pyrinomonadaceae bacterium]|nr:TIM barrel protein [Pyrinomonadaceae bacterium]
MSSTLSRRRFVAGLGLMAAATVVPVEAATRVFDPPLYPPMDLSYFNTPVGATKFAVKFGYAAITWDGNDVQAIKDVSEAGYKGIQLRSNLVPQYASRTQELRDMLAQHRLEMVALSSGGVQFNTDNPTEEIAKHARHAQFVRDVGGRYLQITDGFARRKNTPTASDYKRFGKMATEIGKRAHDLGIPLGYHNHMNNLGETPEDVDRIMNESDPRYVKLELDIAHYFQGGGDPARAVQKYKDRLLFLHIKDVEGPLPGATGNPMFSYRFVELGRGKVNLSAFFDELKKADFNGWAIIELDRVPDKTRTPKESALISKKYLEEKLGMKV